MNFVTSLNYRMRTAYLLLLVFIILFLCPKVEAKHVLWENKMMAYHWADVVPDTPCTNFTVPLTTNAQGPICPGLPVTVTASAGFAQYEWSGPQGQGGTGTSELFTFQSAVSPSFFTFFYVTVTDQTGCTGTGQAMVNYQDNQGPVITNTIPPQTVTITSVYDCGMSLPSFTGLVNATDNCRAPGQLSYSQQPPPGTLVSLGTVQMVTIYVGDGRNAPAFTTFSFTVVDDAAPIIQCPQDQLLNDQTLPSFENIFYYENCNNPVQLSQSPPAQTQLPPGQSTVVITATDLANNVTSCSFSVTAPQVGCNFSTNAFISNASCPPACDGGAFIAVSGGTGPFTFNWYALDGTLYTGQSVNDVCPGTYSIDVTDVGAACSNTISVNIGLIGGCNQVDSDGDGFNDAADNCPFFFNPSQIDLNINGIGDDCELPCNYLFLANAFLAPPTCPQGCNGNAVLDMTGGVPPFSTTFTPANPLAGPFLPNGLCAEAAYLYTVTDSNGCVVNGFFTVPAGLPDTIPPDVDCPDPITINVPCGEEALAPDFSNITVSDNCTAAGNFLINQSVIPGAPLSPGSNIISIEVAEQAGGITYCAAEIIVNVVGGPNCDTVECGPAPEVSIVSVPPTCPGVCDGSVTISVNGGATNWAGGNSLCAGTYPYTITWGDSCSSTGEVVLLEAVDSVTPSLVCPVGDTLFLDENCQIIVPDFTATVSASDNCTPTNELIITQDIPAGTVLSGGIPGTAYTVTVTVYDESGNETSCPILLTLVDSIPPVLECFNETYPDSLNADCQQQVSDWASFYLAQGGATDNCAVLNITQSPSVGTILTGPGPHPVVITANDYAGNTAVCTLLVEYLDYTPPAFLFSCPFGDTIYLDQFCAATVPNYASEIIADGGVSDNCSQPGNITVTQSPAAGSPAPFFNYQVSITATDEAGNNAYCDIAVVLYDTIPPVITCPEDTILVYLPADSCGLVVGDLTFGALVDDNCYVDTILQFPQPNEVISVGSNTITFLVGDQSGNTASCSFVIELVDTTAPTLVCPGEAILAVDENCEAQLLDFTILASFGDACGIASITQNVPAGTVLALGLDGEVTLTATDLNGNTSTCVVYVATTDTLPPVLTCASDTIVALGESCSAELPDMTLYASGVDNCTPVSITQTPSPGTVYNGTQTVTVTLEATDEYSNTTSCSVAVVFADQTPPQLSCPGDITLQLDENCQAVLGEYLSPGNVTDNCGPVNIQQTPAPGTVLTDVQSLPVTVTATDAAGNVSNCQFTVTLEDMMMPTIVCPGNQNLFVDALCSAVLPDYTNFALADDNCPGLVVVQNPPAGLVINGANQLVAVELTVFDAAGNSDNCFFNVTTVDNIAPVVVCPGPQVGFLNGLCQFVLPDYTGLAAISDNCTPLAQLVVVQAPAQGAVVNGNGVFPITITVTDLAGNVSNCVFNLNTIDVLPPAVVCPANQVVVLDANCQGIMPQVLPLAFDECGIAQVIQGPAPGTVYNGPQSVQVTVTVSDPQGNLSNCVSNVVFVDLAPPQILCPDTLVVQPDNACRFIVPSYENLISDNCGFAFWQQTPAPGDTLAAGQTVSVNLSAVDFSQNQNACAFTLVVTGSTVSISGESSLCPGDTLTLTASGNGPFNWSNGAQGPSIQVAEAGLYSVTSTGGACSATGNFEVVVSIDTLPPMINGPADQTLNGTNAAALPDFTLLATATDNCDDSVTISQMPAAGTVYNTNQTVTVILTATDEYGNTATYSFSVTVILSPPVSVCVVDQAAVTWYVDDNATGSNNGTSWANAFTSLQSALAAAQSGHNILVATGTYRPTTGTDRNISFLLKAGVDLFGGFPNGGGAISDPVANPTTLSGDIGVVNQSNDNSMRVVRAVNVGNNVTVCGFVIRDGYTTTFNGSGLYVQANGTGAQSSPSIINTTLRNNFSAQKGGGAFIYVYTNGTANPIFDNCSFIANEAANDGGGFTAIAQTGGSVATLFTDCVFSANITPKKGGGLCLWANAGGNIVVNALRSTFADNVAQGNGGAVWNHARSGGSSVFNTDSSNFVGNSAAGGGALFQYPGGGFVGGTVSNTSFENNSASGSGGAVCVYGEFAGSNGLTEIVASDFTGNTALEGGAVAHLVLRSAQSTLALRRVKIAENVGTGRGGAVFVSTNGLNQVVPASATTEITNGLIWNNIAPNGPGGAIFQTNASTAAALFTGRQLTVYGNAANGQGAAVFNNASGTSATINVYNSIFGENTSLLPSNKPFWNGSATASMNIYHSDLELATCAANAAGPGTITCNAGTIFAENPLFVNPGANDFHLVAGSPAIDAGLAILVTEDLDGNVRPQGNAFDMGAYEYGGPRPLLRNGPENTAETLVVNVFPNPTAGRITLSFQREINGWVQVFDLQGRLLTNQAVTGHAQAQLDLGGQANGVYLVRVVDNTLVKTLRVVVKKP